jgi:predicted  nucleic acid-binding Zn-ribbon protein
METTVKELNEKVIRIEERLKNDEMNIKNLQSLTKEIHTMSCSIVKLTEQISTTNDEIVEIKSDVKALKASPADKFEKIKLSIATAFASGMVSLIISYIFNKG